MEKEREQFYGLEIKVIENPLVQCAEICNRNLLLLQTLSENTPDEEVKRFFEYVSVVMAFLGLSVSIDTPKVLNNLVRYIKTETDKIKSFKSN